MRSGGSLFTGKERDEETGYGYFGARYMDHEQMTMWLSVDPMADKYPGISPYAYCAWNPVKLVDPDGRDLDIPDVNDANHQQTKKDILSLVKEKNRERVTFNEDGSVSINREGLSDWQLMEGDKGLGLLYDMVESEKKFFYETSDDYSSVMEDGQTHSMVELQHGVVNASNNGRDSDGGYTHKPKAGYDGHVILAKSGSWRTKRGDNLKPSLLFHELAENYYRTDKGFDYKKAHSEAIKREGVAAYHNTSPGTFNQYKVVYIFKGAGRARWSID